MIPSKTVITANVPCNGCTICCRGEALVLHPEMGDKIEDYECEQGINPITGEPAHILKHQPNGDCIYLGETACTIHGRAPAICREFDCRRFVLQVGTRAERRKLIALGIITKELCRAGTERLHTL